MEGQGRIDGKNVDFTLHPDTFFPAGDSGDNYYSAIGYSVKEAEQYARRIKDTVNDKEEFTKIISYPVSVDLDGRRIVINNLNVIDIDIVEYNSYQDIKNIT